MSVLIMLWMISCQREDTPVREIDQVSRIYIDSAGIDMLNDSLNISYKTRRYYDALGLTDNAAVSLQLKQNKNGRYFLEYTAGAVRKTLPTEHSPTIVRSIIAFQMAYPAHTTASILPIQDTLILDYRFSDAEFRLISARYNGKEALHGKEENAHRIEIHK